MMPLDTQVAPIRWGAMAQETSRQGQKRWHYELLGVKLIYYLRVIFEHLDLLITVLSPSTRRVLEVGCGTASHSCLLSYFGAHCFSLDRNAAAMVAAAETKRRFGGRNQVVRGDAFYLPFVDDAFDVCFSAGVMEHFSDDDIVWLLREQTRVGKRVVFSVPSDHYPLREFGDERRLSPHQWMQILTPCSAAMGARVHARYQRFDLKRVKDVLVERRRLGPRFVLCSVRK
jgi:SAM-dependent methyltransferase